ncbi:hypothetical protein DFH06DRAFT_1302521 [Mycena polygramma]|nr:hypothetical protein DFH06DRAFT_1302521 [Mycena polygramma]
MHMGRQIWRRRPAGWYLKEREYIAARAKWRRYACLSNGLSLTASLAESCSQDVVEGAANEAWRPRASTDLDGTLERTVGMGPRARASAAGSRSGGNEACEPRGLIFFSCWIVRLASRSKESGNVRARRLRNGVVKATVYIAKEFRHCRPMLLPHGVHGPFGDDADMYISSLARNRRGGGRGIGVAVNESFVNIDPGRPGKAESESVAEDSEEEKHQDIIDAGSKYFVVRRLCSIKLQSKLLDLLWTEIGQQSLSLPSSPSPLCAPFTASHSISPQDLGVDLLKDKPIEYEAHATPPDTTLFSDVYAKEKPMRSLVS